MLHTIQKSWIPLLLVMVIAAGAYAVLHIRNTFGRDAGMTAAAEDSDDIAEPFHPKHITYEITGSAGGRVDVDYLDENGQPHRVDGAPLPWSLTIITTLPSMSANVVAQGATNVRALRCRVVVDDQVRDDRRSDEYNPFIYCLVKMV